MKAANVSPWLPPFLYPWSSLRRKFITVIVIVQLAVMGLVTVLIEHRQQKTILAEARKRALSLAANLAALSEGYMLSYNFVKLEQTVAQIATEDDVAYAIVQLHDGKVAAFSGRLEQQGQLIDDPVSRQALQAEKAFLQVVSSAALGGEGFEVAIPVFAAGGTRKWGTVRLGLSLVDARREIRKTSQGLFLLGFMALALSTGSAVFLALRISKPIQHLVHGVDAVTRGNYDQAIVSSSRDEVGYLAQRFEEMRQALRLHVTSLAAEKQHLEEANRTIKATQEQLIQTEKLSALGELISGFAHELNNPLTTVLGYAELLLRSTTCPPKVQFMLEKSHEEAVRCHQIVQNLLGFARKHKPAKHYLDVNSICLKTRDLLAYQFKVNNITLVTRLDESLPWTMIDAHQIQQVLVNILSNACQAMADYQGPRQLTITSYAETARLCITIADTGPGMTPEQLHRIFDPFFTTKEKGTGLGLSLSYGLVKEHGGEIVVASAPGEGATFTIILPMVAAPPAEATPCTTPPPTVVTPKKILVVDDEPPIAQMLVDTLQFMGHQTDVLHAGRAALERLASQAYDLIICDMRMPDVDGRQLYHFIQQHHPDLLPRLVLASGDTVSEAHKQFLQETPCLFLPKPFLLEELQQVIAQTSEASAT